uniref:Uncharacterized protein n=1 Tax=Ciona savignyi TaxID=51511 RepID=H2Y5R3_CIOSA
MKEDKNIEADPQIEEEDPGSIFSDEESIDAEDEDDDDLVALIPGFLEEVRRRGMRREELSAKVTMENKGTMEDEFRKILGVEHRVIGCCTFERSYEIPAQRLLQLTLVAVRKKFRGAGLGHFMV